MESATISLDALLLQWKKVNLSGLKKDIDQDAVAMEQRKEERTASREKLKTNTKAFKKTLDDSMKKKFSSIVTLYQTEVQNFLKMCKQSDTAFFSIFERLINVEDPYPFLVKLKEKEDELQKAMAKVKDLEMSSSSTESKLQKYKTTLSGAKQNETTIRHLEDQIANLEVNIESRVEDRVKEELRRLEEEYSNKTKHYEQERVQLLQSVQEAQKQVHVAEDSAKQATLESHNTHQKFEEEFESMSRALDMATSQAEMASTRADSLQAELEMCRKQLSQALSVDTSQHQGIEFDQQYYEEELQQKDKELTRVLTNHHTLQSQFTSMKQDFEQRLQSTDATSRQYEEEIGSLRTLLKDREDYAQIKEELSVLRNVEFGDNSDSTTLSLEMLLKKKNSALETENSNLRNRIAELEQQFETFKATNNGNSAVVGEQRQLIAQLEEQLSVLNPENFQRSTNAAENDESSTGKDSMLHIVTSQRDRFRKKILELETDLNSEKLRTQTMQSEVDKIRADNVKLYEKIKFLQAYNKQSHNNDKSSEDVMMRYSSQYEDKLSPFQEFSSNERRRRVQNLNAGDRFTLSLGRAILGNKHARWTFIIYAVILHLLIFVVLYKYSHVDMTMNLVEKCHHLFANKVLGDGAHGVHFDSEELSHTQR